ncbi:MAG TPA: aromatic ring-hydroxylating dioxygenase subunit alpha [Stellaceae bacterium]|nr:aromatic ring-hydroxylating dioxygenase subunit alpha [Stellaceae bacterium]
MTGVDLAAAKREAAALLARRRRGYSLEAPFYLDAALFELDIAAIFARHWIHVGTAAEIPDYGDVMTIELGRYSLIILRGRDREIRAFHNVCRHRGSRILMSRTGKLRSIVCRYHNWSYDLEGRLLDAEHIASGVDRDCLGLKRVHLRNLGGLLFVCLAEEPPDDFEEMRRTVLPYLAPHRLEDCKVAHQADLVEDGNWKAVMENNRECYHCTRHPELLRTFFQFFGHAESDVKPRQREYYERFQRITAEFHAIWDGLGLAWRPVERLDDRATAFRVERMPLDNAGESYTIDTRIACRRLLGQFTTPRLGALSIHTQPNSWNHFLSDHAVIFSALPLTVDKTLVRTTWLVHKEAVEGRDYDLGHLTEVWSRTNEQDATFVGWCSSGVRSPAYEPGPYSPNESQLEKFLEWYIDRLSAFVGEPVATRSAPAIESAHAES